jgi:transcriptional regulator with PAS, ATPase and Fis domain
MNLCFEEEEKISTVTATEWTDLKTHEQTYIERMMVAHNDDKEEVANILGISTRSLYRKLQE